MVHNAWEHIDPTPNIHLLFNRFNLRFFEGKLTAVELEWSKRMYQCAGICYQRRVGGFKSCVIRLSEPLLSLRSRKELVETLLHEMIHAFLFVLNIREGNGGHGPNFLKKSHEINRIAGTNITVYHTFHDEVAFYKKHWWRCDGPCKERQPYFGYVKRTSNRAPGPNDLWWAQHQATCCGKFIKVKEPTTTKKQGGAKRAGKGSQKNLVSDWVTRSPKVGTSKDGNTKPNTGNRSGSGTAVINRGSGTIVIRKPPPIQKVPPVKPITQPPKPTPSTPNLTPTQPAGNLVNVRGFNNNGTPPTFKRPIFNGVGHTLGGSAGPGRSRLLDTYDNPSKRPKIEESSVEMSSDDDLTEAELEQIFSQIDQKEAEGETRRNQIQNEITNEHPDFEDIILLDDDFDDDHPDAKSMHDNNLNQPEPKSDNKESTCCICGMPVPEKNLHDHVEICVIRFFDSPQSSPVINITSSSSDSDLSPILISAMDLEPISPTTSSDVPVSTTSVLDTPQSSAPSTEEVMIIETPIDIIEISDSPIHSPVPQIKNEEGEDSPVLITSYTSYSDSALESTPPQLSSYTQTDLRQTLPSTIVFCPNCPKTFRYADLNEHLDSCLA